jgi:hypothetical protein
LGSGNSLGNAWNETKGPNNQMINETEKIYSELLYELQSARSKYPAFHSAHEGYATILEELDELWDEIKKKPNRRNILKMRTEAIQVGAMAIRFICDVCNTDKQK